MRSLLLGYTLSAVDGLYPGTGTVMETTELPLNRDRRANPGTLANVLPSPTLVITLGR
jgi:hypothetical protein